MVCVLCMLFTFQSTLPARGATHRKTRKHDGDGISIHAPREGSDRDSTKSSNSLSDFNPRSPRGERHPTAAKLVHRFAISIHAPREGSDFRLLRHKPEESISIHAPREGSDGLLTSIAGAADRFQSTLPARGATRLNINDDGVLSDFNPRSPRGERQPCRCGSKSGRTFQSTLPARGATTNHGERASDKHYFNPRSPRGERRAWCGYARSG